MGPSGAYMRASHRCASAHTSPGVFRRGGPVAKTRPQRHPCLSFGNRRTPRGWTEFACFVVHTSSPFGSCNPISGSGRGGAPPPLPPSHFRQACAAVAVGERACARRHCVRVRHTRSKRALWSGTVAALYASRFRPPQFNLPLLGSREIRTTSVECTVGDRVSIARGLIRF
jgi:hypothetical protein